MNDDSGNLTNTNRRFEIFVPSPKARINLGAPNKDTTGPFGYTGVSIQSDVHLFIDANKHTLFQTGQSYCGQVGGKWQQYSNADMVLSSTKSVNLSADKKIVVAAGAGQGQVTALDHGTAPKLVGYNDLSLHYRVDRLQTSLFEFFHGRRERDEHTGKVAQVLAFGGAETTYFDGKGNGARQAQKEGLLAGGFAFVSADSLRELYPVAKPRAVLEFEDDVKEPGDPIALLDALVHKKVVGKSKTAKNLKYGFSAYLSRFDPYARIDRSKITHPVAKGLAGLLNTLADMRRFADVSMRYADLVTDNFLMKRAQAAMGALDGLLGTLSSAYAVVDMTFGPFLPNASQGMWDDFGDEAAFGVDARAGAGSFADVGQAADDAKAKAGGKKASIQSIRGPFDLGGTRPLELTLAWGDGDPGPHTVTVDLTDGQPASPAEMTFSVDADALLALPVTLRVDLDAVDPGSGAPVLPAWADRDAVLEWLAGAVDATAGEVRPTLAAGATTYPPPDTVRALLTDRPSFLAETETFTDTSGTTSPPATVTVARGDLATYTVAHRAESFELSVDGHGGTVSLDTSSVDFTDPAQPGQVVLDAITAAVGGAGTVSGASGSVTVESLQPGATSRIVVVEGDDWLLSELGVERGAEARGREAVAGLSPSELSNVTAAQIAARIPAQDRLTVSTSGGTLRLESGYAPTSARPSAVKASGPVADVLFDGVSDRDVVEEEDVDEAHEGLAAFEAGRSKLLAWNHELQKLPEDTRNLTRPLRNAIDRVVGTVSKLESTVEKAMEFVGGPMKGLPSPPEAIGLLADEGITLGTRDRIVGVGGKGVVFIADGGSGEEDHAKFIPKVEPFVNLALSWDPIDRKLKEVLADSDWIQQEKERVQSLGFRVMSNSTVDLFGTHSAQLMALGRGKLAAAGPDGKTLVGTGVVRVGGSHAAEIAGYRKVVVSARNAGSDDTTGGRVEVAGQTIAIGGMNVDGDTQDFQDAPEGFGIQPLEVEKLAGAEDLSTEELDALKDELACYAWPETLREGGAKGHPNTQRVLVHAEKETVIQVGSYLVHVAADGGVHVGTRKPNADATVNEIDLDKPHLELDDTMLSVYANADTRAHFDADGVGLFHKSGSDAALVTLEDGELSLTAGTQDTVTVKQGETKVSSAKVGLLGKSAVEIKANGTIKLG
ncbi:MAG TPA: hypothetical protein RMH99_31165 [Sandaracinaceae bacterium LLY-WYZ-13_1]|nr:hypothetical protein [Sandaracinaceae bacterium LLY-WYZ-13_1]